MSGSTDGLSRLVARFTADRDELMTRVQECQDRVSDLVERLESTECQRPAAAAPDPQMQSVEILRAEIAALEAELAARTDTEAAWKAAILEARAALDERLVELQTEIGTTYDRLAPLEQFQTRMEVAMEQWMHDPSAAGVADRGPETTLLRERIEVLAAGLTRLSEGMQDLGAMRASLAGMHRRIDEMGSSGGEVPVGMVDAIERIRTDLEALRGEVGRHVRPDAIAGLTEGLTEVRLAISALKNQLRSLDTAITTGLRSTTTRWDSEARALAARIDDVSRLLAAHAAAHQHSLQDRATEWARIAGTMVATEIQRLGKRLPSVSLPKVPKVGSLWDAPTSLFRKPW